MIAKMSRDAVFIYTTSKYRQDIGIYKKPLEGSLMTSQYTGILQGFSKLLKMSLMTLMSFSRSIDVYGL